MTPLPPRKSVPVPRQDLRVALACAAGALSMVGLAYAAVPLYQLFCQATGFGGTTMRATAPSSTMLDRRVTVRFDSNVAPDLGWTFEPVQRTMDVRLGENTLAFYRATNTSKEPVTGTASFNVAPDTAGLHFSKIECFCFTEQTLQPGESIEMPVSFFVDPKLATDPDAAYLTEIALSYTFYRVKSVAGASPAQGDKG